MCVLPASGCPRNFHLASFIGAAGYGCLGQKQGRAAALWRLGIGRGLLRLDSGSGQKLGGILAGGGWELLAARRARNENHEPERATSLQGTIKCDLSNSISGLVVEYIVAIDVTRVRFPADAFLLRFGAGAAEHKLCALHEKARISIPGAHVRNLPVCSPRHTHIPPQQTFNFPKVSLTPPIHASIPFSALLRHWSLPAPSPTRIGMPVYNRGWHVCAARLRRSKGGKTLAPAFRDAFCSQCYKKDIALLESSFPDIEASNAQSTWGGFLEVALLCNAFQTRPLRAYMYEKTRAGYVLISYVGSEDPSDGLACIG